MNQSKIACTNCRDDYPGAQLDWRGRCPPCRLKLHEATRWLPPIGRGDSR